MLDFDVVVVGGGPAGAVSALGCSRSGLNVLLMERGRRGRHKPCGGVLPAVCADVVSEAIGKAIPRSVMCSPDTLGLYYVPPSGRKNGGSVRNYRLLNVNRDLFDRWLCELAEESGVQVWYETELLGFEQTDRIRVSAKRDGGIVKAVTRYMIGADGVYSKVRKQLYGGAEVGILPILQEHWRAEGDLGNYFYTFYRGSISPTYAYLIPKDGLFVVGVGTPKAYSTPISASIDHFKEWLAEEFAFKPLSLERREAWAIPYGFVLEGANNVILAGDAAGFCKATSGEGIRLAIESGVAAGDAVREAATCNKALATVYAKHAEWITSFVKQVYQSAIKRADEEWEDFVKIELNRTSFA